MITEPEEPNLTEAIVRMTEFLKSLDPHSLTKEERQSLQDLLDYLIAIQ